MAAQPKKKRFSLFGSPLATPISPNTSSLLSNYFSASIRDEKFPTPDDVRKGVEHFEQVVLAANEYCDSIDKLSRASKTFGKSLKDYGNIKEMDTSHVTCFQATSQFYEGYAEVLSKLNKSIQKDFETLQKFLDKYIKKVTKEEKAHSDYTDDLDRQLNKITADYDKKVKKDNKASAESYEKYMNSVTIINSDIARAHREYATQVSKRERNTHDIITQIICRIVENQNNSFDDAKKKNGSSVTKINEILPLVGTCTQASQDDNEDSSSGILSKPAKEIALITRRLSRRASHKVSQSIASISELQLAAMNYLSPEFSKPSSGEKEYLSSSPPPQIPALIPPDPINLQFNQHISMLSEGSITFENDRPEESDVKSDSPVSSTQTFDTSPQPSPLIPITIKPKTSDLISKISIGIHEDDRPFFRDYDINFSSNDNSEIINNNQDLSNALQSPEKQPIDIENKRLSITTGNSFSDGETNAVDREIDLSKEETKQDSNNEKQLNPEYSFDTRYLVCSFPVDLPVRTPPHSPSTSPRQSHMYHYNPNYANNNNFDSERVEIERKIEPKKRERLQHIFSQSDGYIKYEEKYNDEPDVFASTNNRQSKIICPSPTSTNNEDVDRQRFDNRSATSSPLSIKSDATESEKSRTRASYNLSPRRAYTDYPLPINTNKRAGPSVADLRERLMSLSNDKEKSPTTPRSVPIPRQGHVITLLSKFDAEGSNSRQSPGSSNHSKTEDYFFRNQDLRPHDYNYNNRHYENDVGRNNEFKEEMYADHTRDEQHVLSSQEECDCHICQQVAEKMNSSLDPQDDSSTFGRRSFCENNGNT